MSSSEVSTILSKSEVAQRWLLPCGSLRSHSGVREKDLLIEEKIQKHQSTLGWGLGYLSFSLFIMKKKGELKAKLGHWIFTETWTQTLWGWSGWEVLNGNSGMWGCEEASSESSWALGWTTGLFLKGWRSQRSRNIFSRGKKRAVVMLRVASKSVRNSSGPIKNYEHWLPVQFTFMKLYIIPSPDKILKNPHSLGCVDLWFPVQVTIQQRKRNYIKYFFVCLWGCGLPTSKFSFLPLTLVIKKNKNFRKWMEKVGGKNSKNI